MRKDAEYEMREEKRATRVRKVGAEQVGNRKERGNRGGRKGID
tara:strand:- start:77 stop:205 length:129 start_codon:yes stop_codon:yes gene_type:complete